MLLWYGMGYVGKKIRAKIKIIMPAEIFVCPLKISVGIHFGGHVCPLKNQNWPE